MQICSTQPDSPFPKYQPCSKVRGVAKKAPMITLKVCLPPDSVPPFTYGGVAKNQRRRVTLGIKKILILICS